MTAQRATRQGSASDGDGSVDVASTNGASRPGAYVVPVVHVHLPQRAVDAGFWGALAGAAVFGVVDPPLAALIGAAVLVARHGAKSRA
jgi:hypothetical protein